MRDSISVESNAPLPPLRRGGRRSNSSTVALALLFAVLLPGCRNAQKYDLIEAELRTRERELAEARAELAGSRGLNQAYQGHLTRAPHEAPPARATQLPLREIVLGSGTGGVDNDGKPGDEELQVVVVPRDDDGSSVKVPAQVMVDAYEIGTNGVKTQIGRWNVTPEQLRRTWRGGLFATGFYVTLKWDKPPTTEKLRIAVRLTTLDGRPFEADKDVTVRLLPGIAVPPQAFEELPPPGSGYGPTRLGVPREVE